MKTPACACEAGIKGISSASKSQRAERNTRIEVLLRFDPTCIFHPHRGAGGVKKETLSLQAVLRLHDTGLHGIRTPQIQRSVCLHNASPERFESAQAMTQAIRLEPGQ